jgi:hypothetical protein
LNKYVEQKTEQLAQTSDEESEESQLSLPHQFEKDTIPLPFTKQGIDEDEQDRPLMYHMAGIGRGIRRWFKNLSLPTRVVLAILILYALSLLINVIMQLVMMSMGLIYTILGIVASAIVIWDYFIKKQH